MKQDIRRIKQAQRNTLSPLQRHSQSDIIGSRLIAFIKEHKYRNIALYYGRSDEVQTIQVIKYLLGTGNYIISLPKINHDRLEFRQITSISSLNAGAFGIYEPVIHCPIIKEPALIIMPLISFDRSGNRIGYGKGHYDRALNVLPQSYKVGIAYSIQEYHEIINERHDIKLNLIITESELIYGK